MSNTPGDSRRHNSDVNMDSVYEQISRDRRKERLRALESDFIFKARAILESPVGPEEEDDRAEKVVGILRDEVIPQLEKWGEL